MTIADRLLNENESITAEIPVNHHQEFGTTPVGRIIVSNTRIIFLVKTEGGWKTFDEYQTETEPFPQRQDGELTAVFVPEPDGEHVARLKSDYISAVEDETGLTNVADIAFHDDRTSVEKAQACSCTQISSNKVLVENENGELNESFDQEEFRLVSCENCYNIYGRYRRGKKASLRKLTSADWLMGGEQTDAPIEIGPDNAYGIHHPPNGSTRVQDAVITLSMKGRRFEDGVSTYKHSYQHAFCYIQDDELAGYLSWEPHDRGPVLSQLYVRNEHRGDGIATAMAAGWYEEVCAENHYFADELTEGGRAVLSSTGHLNGNDSQCKEVYSIIPPGFA